ncbi:MAG TPA: class I SAM-dependent methyltransferase, partial [Kribbella sp.]|uniref:class I SAM-dependent methyltransferase n=1 Tax=Kribbella sp. TaxID=1871183 RepID=UPI002D7A18E1
MVDYDERLHRVYAEGRRLTSAALGEWMGAFTGHAPTERPLAVLDLGCGIGRFTPALAETFGGPVYGV